jgi:hypothetical protein
MCCNRKRNCRFKLDKSIVSKSICKRQWQAKRRGDDEDFFKVVETEGFEEFTADPSGSDEESTDIIKLHFLNLGDTDSGDQSNLVMRKCEPFLKGGSESGLGPECFIEVVTNGLWSLNTKKQVVKIFISKRDKLQCVLTHYFRQSLYYLRRDECSCCPYSLISRLLNPKTLSERQKLENVLEYEIFVLVIVPQKSCSRYPHIHLYQE